MRRRTSRLAAIVMVGFSALAMAACASGDGDDAAPDPAVEDQTPEPDARSSPGEDDDAGPSGAPPAGEALARVTLPIGFIEGGELEVAVTSFDVAGELLRMRLTFTASLPTEIEDVAIGAVLANNEQQVGGAISPELIDPVNLKAYDVVTEDFLGTTVPLVDGLPLTMVFYYAAPEDNVEAFDILLSSQAPPLTDVPLRP